MGPPRTDLSTGVSNSHLPHPFDIADVFGHHERLTVGFWVFENFHEKE